MTNHPEAALRALEQKWRARANNFAVTELAEAVSRCANELAAAMNERPRSCPHSTSPLRYCDPCPVSPCQMEVEAAPSPPDLTAYDHWRAMQQCFKDMDNPSPADSSQGEPEYVAQLIAHRACTGIEHDPAHGKLHGCCVVCGVPWPCEYACTPPPSSPQVAVAGSIMREQCVNVRCNACDRSLVGVQCCDRTCDEQGHACGLRPLLTTAAPQSAPKAAEPQWQPIETAPKDGINVWIGAPGHMRVAYWGSVDDETPQAERWVDFWRRSHTGRGSIDFTPTHWMPLPAPPEQCARSLAQAEQAAKGEG